MAQVGPSTLPGIVTDQAEIFESEPALSDDTGINELDLNDEIQNDAICTIDVPMREAASVFAAREHEIFARFFVQKHGEYKLTPNKPDEESDYEKYNRLVIEVNELLNKFQADKISRTEITSESLSNQNVASNLEVLSKQLKALEVAAEDGSLEPTQSGFNSTKNKLKKFEEELLENVTDEPAADLETKASLPRETAQLIRMGALEKRLNLLERLLGHNEEKKQNLLKLTNCDSLVDVSDTLCSWLSLFKPDSIQRVNRELDYLNQVMEKINSEQASNEENNKLDPQAKSKLDHLCNLVVATDEYRAKVPAIIQRLNSMEELQQKAAQVVETVAYLEEIQSKINENLHWNKDELKRLNEDFSTNLELIKAVSKDIDTKIMAIRDRD